MLWWNAFSSVFHHMVTTWVFTCGDETHFHAFSVMVTTHVFMSLVTKCIFMPLQAHCDQTHFHAFSGIWWQHACSRMFTHIVTKCIFTLLVTACIYDLRALMITCVFTCVATRCVFAYFQVFVDNMPGVDTSEHACCDNTQFHVFLGVWQQHACSLMFTHIQPMEATCGLVWSFVAATCLITYVAATRVHMCGAIWWQDVFTCVEVCIGNTHVLTCSAVWWPRACSWICQQHDSTCGSNRSVHFHVFRHLVTTCVFTCIQAYCEHMCCHQSPEIINTLSPYAWKRLLAFHNTRKHVWTHLLSPNA